MHVYREEMNDEDRKEVRQRYYNNNVILYFYVPSVWEQIVRMKMNDYVEMATYMELINIIFFQQKNCVDKHIFYVGTCLPEFYQCWLIKFFEQ